MAVVCPFVIVLALDLCDAYSQVRLILSVSEIVIWGQTTCPTSASEPYV